MNKNQVEQFLTIVNEGHITTVYQPIVSLQDGTILGYEALSRIKLPACTLNIEQLFHLAAQEKKLWELEKICRLQALKNAVSKPVAAKLFINVDANIIHDPALKSGFTSDKLKEYGLDPNDIIFEITEKSAIQTMGAMVSFCQEGGIQIIAEGIETEAELKTLIRIGVNYGQGYYFAKPAVGFCEIGYNLRAKRTAGELMTKQYLAVERSETIDEVARMAMNRQASMVYDAVIVTDHKQYVGVVTVKNLFTTAVNIQVKRATDASPLTGLPGNAAIQNIISSTIDSGKPFAIIYLDLDNFKAYNDAYGFTHGDRMIQAVAEAVKGCCTEEDFKGHIGGDDFVIVTTDVAEAGNLCQQIIKHFLAFIKPLYSEEDWQQGYIVSRNRNGFVEQFAIATLSIAVVTNGKQRFTTLNELSQAVAETKKSCKKVSGNSGMII